MWKYQTMELLLSDCELLVSPSSLHSRNIRLYNCCCNQQSSDNYLVGLNFSISLKVLQTYWPNTTFCSSLPECVFISLIPQVEKTCSCPISCPTLLQALEKPKLPSWSSSTRGWVERHVNAFLHVQETQEMWRWGCGKEVRGFAAPNRAARQSHFSSHVYIPVLQGKQMMDPSEVKKKTACTSVTLRRVCRQLEKEETDKSVLAWQLCALADGTDATAHQRDGSQLFSLLSVTVKSLLFLNTVQTN